MEGLAEVKAQLDSLTDALKSSSEQAGEMKALALSVAENG